MPATLQRLIALVLLFCPTALFALGLGEIRLNSALNEPLDAEIELVGAAPDELGSVRATLANTETFARYGLERPPFLSKIEFKVGQGRDGRPALLVRTRESVPDAFLTLLVDVNWARGRLLREYTMLLDPPVYTPGGEQASSAPVSAPQAGESESASSGTVQRPAEPAPVAPAPAPSSGVSRAPEAAPAPSLSAESSYTVRNNDTLWRIASGLRPGETSDVNRMMLAIYRSNPEAFSANINQLHAGAILRLPSDADFESVGAAEANAEVRRQYAQWRESRGQAAAAGAQGERLRLVTPTEGGEGTGTQAAAGAAQTQELRDKVQQLESQLAESRRLLEVKDSELAKLQQQTGQQPQPVPTPAPPAAQTEQPPAEQAPPAEAQPPAPTETPPAATTTPAVEPQPTPTEQPKPPAPAAAPTEQPSMLDWAIEHWYYALAALLILVLLWLATRRRRKEPDFTSLGRLADAARAGAAREPRMDREPVTAPVRTTRAEDTFLVEESGERQQPKIVRAEEPAVVERPKAEPARAKKSADDTLSSETAINLDQGDPLAEADFHMAYGLYDQAADLVRIAIEREPKRRDLRLKLLEIFFVWGNKESFLEAARELAQSRAEAGPGEWEKIAIMGRQISPEDPLFAQAPGAAGAAAADVDLNLEGGENRVDLDLLGPPEGEAGGAIDLDLGTAGADDTTATTGESPTLKDRGVDFPLHDQTARLDGSATTREMAAVRTAETPTVETEYRTHDVPTVESPTLRGRESSTIKEKIDSALFRKDETSPDQTAELALDDLGLELNELEAAQSDALEETDHPSNAPTMLAGLDEKSRRLLAEAEARRKALSDEDDTKISPTGTWVLEDKTLAATLALPGAPERDTSATTARNRALAGDGDGDTTARRRKLEATTTTTAQMPRAGGTQEMDLDLDRLEAALTSDTVKQPRKGAAEEDRFATDVFGAKDLAATDLDLDVGEVKHDRDREPTSTARIPADEMGLPELEPVTMSEVGTKLDLARAYMDMGDPEGARSILEEVLQEGSATQKQEAQRLIESLPG